MSEILTAQPSLILVHRDPDAVSIIASIASSLDVRLLVLSEIQPAFEQINALQDGCLVTDQLGLESGNSAKLAEFIRTFPAIPAVVWSAQCDVTMLANAYRLGVMDVLRKPMEDSLLSNCIGRALRMGADRLILLRKKKELMESFAQLVSSERDVLSLLLAGKTNKEISYRLECSQRTVESRRQHILRVMQADSAIELGKIMGYYELLQSLTTMHPWLN